MKKTFLITGANRGIGLALTDLALTKGGKVIACCREPSTATTLNSLSKKNKQLTIVPFDVTEEDQINTASALVKCPIDILVCNAGATTGYGGIASPENNKGTITNVLMTNIAGPFFTTRAFLPQVLRSATRKIVIISSLMGSQQHTSPNAHIYRASKAGANNLMRTLSNELCDKGIAVAAYHPGWVRTDMGGANADLSAEDSARALLDRFEELTIENSGIFKNFNGETLQL